MKINKQKKKILTIILILAILIPLTTIIINNQNNTPLPLTNQPNNNILLKSSGTGGTLQALLTQTNNTNTTTIQTNTTTDFWIKCPSSWNITYANITLADITAPNYTIQTNNSQRDDKQSLDTERGMSFNLTNSAYLNDISALIEKITPGETQLILNIYNSTWVSGKPKPDKPITSSVLIDLPSSGGTGNWIRINKTLSTPLLLNINRTENNTFFISLVRSQSGFTLYWGCVNFGTQGYAYDFSSSNYLDLDFVLKANVSANTSPNPPESVFPSNITLRINGANVSNTANVGEGFCEIFTASGESSGSIYFDVTSTWMVPVNYTVTFTNVTYGKYVDAATNYTVDAGSDANWDVTVVATGSNGFPENTTIVHNFVNVTVPLDWWNITGYALNYSNSEQREYISTVPSLIFEATNGTWILMCGAPNYVSSITVLNQGVNVTGAGAILIDNLTINVTLNQSVTGGYANLSIYDSPSTIKFGNTTSGIIGGWFVFPLDVQNNLSSVGFYNITVSFNTSLQVGYGKIGNFQVYQSAGTRLTVVSSPEYVRPPGYGNVTVKLERTDINMGVSGVGAYINVSGSGVAIYDVADNGNGVYFVLVNFTSEGTYTFRVTFQGHTNYDSTNSNEITVFYGVPPATDISFLLLSSVQSQIQSQRSTSNIFLMFGLVGSVVAVGAGGFVVNRRRKVPLKAMASLENIIVDHIGTGITLWAFDFFRMEQDVTLVSGFMTAVKTFMGEMQKGGLRKLETEFGTFIREEGAFLAATCITSGNSSAEEKWIRKRLRSFLSTAEQENYDALVDWKGDAAPFRKSFPEILASVIDLEKTEKLQRERVSRMEAEKERLREELNGLGSQLEFLSRQLENKAISKAEFEAGKARIEPEYDRVQNEYIRVSLFLSRAPSKLEVKRVKPEVTEEVGKIKERFLKIQLEIEELRRKEDDGTITSKDVKRRDKLYAELVDLIEKLDKLQK